MNPLLQGLVTAQADRRPEAPAVVMGPSVLLYGALETTSNQLARLLRAHGCRRGDRVCLLAPKSPEAIVAILAIYKADAIYVPLDLSSPPARLARVIQSCGPKCVLLAQRAAGLVDELIRLEALDGPDRPIALGALEPQPVEGDLFRTAFTLSDAAAESPGPLPYRNWATDPAHILFTSGSTGQPKGVLITHANVRHFVLWANQHFGVRTADRHSAHSPLPFDLSIHDIFGTLAAGACLYPVPTDLNIFPRRLTEFIRSSRLTQWFSTPAVLSYLAQLDALQPVDFPAMKRVIWCGEVLQTPALQYWMDRVPHASFTNLYGPTEATIASSYYTVSERPADGRAAIPIGTACPGEELLVLDSELHPVAPGEVGEICIRGVGLSPGYWRNPAATEAAFRSLDTGDPLPARIYRTGDLGAVGPDGLVYFHGRQDIQVKSRGHRIELGEIEAALHTLPSLQDAAVVAIPTWGFEGVVLGCAYVPARGHDVTPASLRQDLARLLPPYMLPSQWRALDCLPLTANGKVDRRQIRERFADQASLTRERAV